MKRTALFATSVLGLATLTACQSYAPGVRAPCTTGAQIMEAEVIGFEADSVIVNGPDGPFNVSNAYLTEQPQIGDILRISPTVINGSCVYTPTY